MDDTFEKIEYLNDWEKYYTIADYHSVRAWVDSSSPEDQIEMQKKYKKYLAKIPEDGEILSKTWGSYNLGLFYRKHAYFNEAIENFSEALEIYEQLENHFRVWVNNELGILHNLRGEFDEALRYFKRASDTDHNTKRATQAYLFRLSRYLFSKGQFQKAIFKARERVEYHLKTDFGKENKLMELGSYVSLFSMLIAVFESTHDRQYYTDARQVLAILNELYDEVIAQYPERTVLPLHKKLHNARLLSYGTIRERAQAMDLLEEIVSTTRVKDHFPRILLVEMLFQDYNETEDRAVLKQIESLMSEIRSKTIRRSPEGIVQYVKDAILLANYDALVSGEINSSLQQLIDAKSMIENRGIRYLEELLDREIERLEQLNQEWTQVDVSLKEKLHRSSIKQYLKDARKLADLNT